MTVTPGTTVTWTNTDKVSHTITSGKSTDDNAGSMFDSGLVKPGKTFQFTFANAGTYNYFCTVHPWMTGQVIVDSGSPPSTPIVPRITASTDRSSYTIGDTITISGTVSEQINVLISIIIKDPSQHIVHVAQTKPNSDNTYSIQLSAGGYIWKTSGTYEIDVAYGGPNTTSKTTFQFTGSSVGTTSTLPPTPLPSLPIIPSSNQIPIINKTSQINGQTASTLPPTPLPNQQPNQINQQQKLEVNKQAQLKLQKQKLLDQMVEDKTSKIISSRDEFYNDNDDVHTLIYKGNAFINSSRYVDAFKYFDKALSKDPKNSEAQNGKNMAYDQIHQLVTSLIDIDENPNNINDANSIASKGVLLAKLQSFDDSLSICNSALQLSPDNYNAMECKIAALYKLGKYDEMNKFIQNSSTLSTSFGVQQGSYKIVLLYQLEKYDELTSYIDAIGNTISISGSGSFYGGSYGSSANQAVAVGLLMYKAAVAEKAGKTDLANSYYAIITSSIGGDPNAIKGSIFYLLRDYDKAVFYLEKAPYNQNIGYFKVIAYDEIARNSAAYKVQNSLEHFQNSDQNKHKFCILFWCF